MSRVGEQPAPAPSLRPSVLAVLSRPRWILAGVITLVAAATMVGLGIWQVHRYAERTSINNRIDAAARAQPVPVEQLLSARTAPPDQVEYDRVTATGRYDQSHEILARGRTVDHQVGFEVLTPLVLADGSAVLVDRGWIPPAPGGARAVPSVPAAPVGTVTVVGKVRLPESGRTEVERRDGRAEVRRIDPIVLGRQLPYPVYGGYVTADSQTPPADRAFSGIPVEREDPGQNLSYIVQWWLFAALTLVGFGWLARREARLGPARDRSTTPAA